MNEWNKHSNLELQTLDNMQAHCNITKHLALTKQ
jgi:hypothetical protein